MGLRVTETGESESRKRIGVASNRRAAGHGRLHITPRESEQTSQCGVETRESMANRQTEQEQMTATDAGAAPDQIPAFSEDQLRQAEIEVSRLQARIVKATQARRWNKVKVLQYLLTHSHSAKILAVVRVVENQGRVALPVLGGTASLTGRLRCLSRVRGNSHARF